MKKLITIAILAAMAAGFTGCSDNDDEFKSDVISVAEELESIADKYDPSSSSEAAAAPEVSENAEAPAVSEDAEPTIIGEPLTSPIECVKFHGSEYRFYKKWNDVMVQFRGMPDIWGYCNYSTFGSEDYDRIFKYEASANRTAIYTTKIGLAETAPDYKDLEAKHNVDGCSFDFTSDPESDNGFISGCDSRMFTIYDGILVINGQELDISTATEQDIYDILGTENMKALQNFDMQTMEYYTMDVEYQLSGYDLNYLYFDLEKDGSIELVRVKEKK